MAMNPPDSSLFFSKKDPRDPRLGDWTRAWTGVLKDLTSAQADLAVYGAADDEGIVLNGGRPGAKEAPKQIRSFFYKMTPHVSRREEKRIVDLGDIKTQDVGLGDRHEQGLHLSQTLTANKVPFISLGGGHDYGYPDSAGFVRASLISKQKPVVINFDAHLDVRPSDKGYNSGTPFYRLLSEFGQDVDFLEVGLQPQCNSQYHWDWAEAQGATLLGLEKVSSTESLLQELKSYLSSRKDSPVFLSLDIDSLTSNEAPGCSQSWTTGLKTDHLLAAFSHLYKNHYVAGLGIYEVSPPLDSDNRTSKLAALFMHHFLFAERRAL